MPELAELKLRIVTLEAEVNRLKITMPNWISLGDASQQIGKSRDTIRKYLKSNFEPEIDFKYFGAKIYMSRDALFLVRTHYEK